MKTNTFKYFGLALMAILMVQDTIIVRLICVAVPGLVSTGTWTVTIAVRNWISF